MARKRRLTTRDVVSLYGMDRMVEYISEAVYQYSMATSLLLEECNETYDRERERRLERYRSGMKGLSRDYDYLLYAVLADDLFVGKYRWVEEDDSRWTWVEHKLDFGFMMDTKSKSEFIWDCNSKILQQVG